MFDKYICFVFLSASYSNCANILALYPTASYSHQIAYTHLWKALSLRGHKVTLLTTNPLNDPKLINLTELDIKWAYKYASNVSSFAEHDYEMWTYHTLIWNHLSKVSEEMLSSSIGQNLLHKRNAFDLVFVTSIVPELLAFAEIYRCPKILTSSMGFSSIYHNLIGESGHPILYPEFVTPLHGKLNFGERIMSTLVTWYFHCVYVFVLFPNKERILRQYFNSTSQISDLISDIDMLFLSANPLIQGPKAIGQTVITIGGHREDVSLQPISSDVQTFLDNASEGCIYVSLGSNVKSSQLSQSLLKRIVDALSEIPYKVLWKFETEITTMPKNIKTATWLPQQKVLNHPNVKLFLCQGGLQSMEESIYGEVPFVIIPFFSDQYQNARILKDKGIAVVLDKKNVRKEELKKALMEVMNNPKYRDGVKKLKQLILDEPMTGVEKAVWWTEYVIRNKGAKHLRNPAADLPFYQYYLLDVIGFLLLAITLTIVVAIVVLKKLYKLVRTFYHKKEKTK